MSTEDDRPDDPTRPVEPGRDAATDGSGSDGGATAYLPRPGAGEDDSTRPLERVDRPTGPPTGLPPVPPRPSERPVTDPHGPGTTFFTNHPDDVAAREKDAYGGFHVGSAFFGWLVAVGLGALLLGLLSLVGVVLGVTAGQGGDEVLDVVDLGTAGVVAAVAVGLALFLAYLGGGYVAGRMARFDGLKQGLAVWLWALVISLALGVLGYLAGDRLDVLAQLDTLGLPAVAGDLTAAGAITAGVVALVTLLGALAGGALGTRYHRKVDRVGLLDDPGSPARG